MWTLVFDQDFAILIFVAKDAVKSFTRRLDSLYSEDSFGWGASLRLDPESHKIVERVRVVRLLNFTVSRVVLIHSDALNKVVIVVLKEVIARKYSQRVESSLHIAS